MEFIVEVLQLANTLSPLAVIALLVVAVILLVKNQKKVDTVNGTIDTVRDNHLHDVVDRLDKIAESLQRMEVSMSENFSHIKARINGSK